jgi:hypothetical protein
MIRHLRLGHVLLKNVTHSRPGKGREHERDWIVGEGPRHSPGKRSWLCPDGDRGKRQDDL